MPGFEGTAGSENTLVAFMNSLPDAIFICRPDRTIVEVNSVVLRLYGVSRDEAVKLSLEQVFLCTEDSLERFQDMWDQAVEGKSQCFSWKASKPGDGSVFDAEVFIRRAKLDDGDNYLIMSVRDLTLPAITECVLRGSQATYVEMVQCINGIILQVDKDGKIRFINRFAQEFFGYSDREIVGRNIIGTIIPATSTAGQDLSTLIRRIIQNPDQYIYNENENMRRNGERVWIAWTNKALVNDHGDVAALLCTGINITDLKRTTEDLRLVRDHLEILVNDRTAELVQSNESLRKENSERKEVEKALKESERKSRAIFDQTYEFIGLMAPDGRLLEANRTALDFAGAKESNVIGLPLWDTPWWTHSSIMQEKLRAAVEQAASGQFVRFEATHKSKEGFLRCIDFSLKPVTDESGNVDLVIPEGRDITDRKQIELQLYEAKRLAELYVDLMGHDINNMNQMGIGYLELALESYDQEKTRELITMSIAMLRDSSRLIGNVEKLQQVAAGTVKHEAIDVGKVLSEMISLYAGMPGREITINYQQITGCTVMANELVKEVFSNILANAVKFSSGPLTINVKLDRVRADGRDYCCVAIEDNGPGIRNEIKSGIFTRFKRGETKARGKGLGLYLVKTIVDSFHGHVCVEDRVPGDYSLGSRFLIMLPVAGQGRRV